MLDSQIGHRLQKKMRGQIAGGIYQLKDFLLRFFLLHVHVIVFHYRFQCFFTW